MLELMPTAEVWHLGLFRDERTLQPVEYYNKLPDSHSVDLCLILDPMLATGGSMISAITLLKSRGATDIRALVLVAAPEGIAALAAYGFVATLQHDGNFGRILAAYGGIFVAGSLGWGVVMDGFRPDRYDIAGAIVCILGVGLIMFAPRAV